MNIQEELRINGQQPTVGYAGTNMAAFSKALWIDISASVRPSCFPWLIHTV